MALKIVKSATATAPRPTVDYEQMAEDLIRSLERQEDADGYVQLGVVLQQQAKLDKALIALKRALELGADSANAYNAMGVILFQLEWPAAAERFFRRAIERDPMHPGAKKNLVEAMKAVRDLGNDIPGDLQPIMQLLELRAPTLALCMIVKNEEEFLPGCLESVRGVADEIIVVDTGSTDRTVQIAERFGAKVYHFPWTGDFAAARNESLRHATADWILVLDADERLATESTEELRRIIRDKGRIGYSLVIENLLGKKEGDGHQMALIFRLFLNRPDMRYEGIIHEQMILAAQRTGMPNGISTVRIIHHGYMDQCMSARDKFRRNLDILLQQVEQEPENPYVYFNLGQTYKLDGQIEASIENFEISLAKLKGEQAPLAIPYYANLYFSLAEAYRQHGDYDKAMAMCEEGMERFPNYADLLYTKGHIYVSQGDFEQAIAEFKKVRSFAGTVFAAGTDPSITTYKNSNAIAVCYAKMGKLAEAKRHFLEAEKEWPNPTAELYSNLGVIALQEGSLKEATGYFTRALEKDPEDLRAWLNLGSLCSRQGNIEEAIAAWQKALELSPELQDTRFLLGETLLKKGDFIKAEAQFRAELELNADNASARLALGAARLLQGDAEEAGELWNGPDIAEFAAARAFLALLSGLPLPSGWTTPETRGTWVFLLEAAIAGHAFTLVEQIMNAVEPLEEEAPWLNLELAKLFQRWELHDLAIEFLLRAQRRTPADAQLYGLLGESCLAKGLTEDAQTMFTQAVALDPGHPARQRLREVAS